MNPSPPSHRNSVTYLHSHSPVTVSPHRHLSPALFRPSTQAEDAALYRLRRNYASREEISSRDIAKSRAKSVKLLPKCESRPITPYLGVNFRQSSSEVTWKSHFAPPPYTSRPHRVATKLTEPRGNRISLVSVGQDLQSAALELPKQQELTILAKVALQKSTGRRETRAKTPNSNPEIVIPRLVPVPIPVNTETRREIRPEDLYDLLIPTQPEAKVEEGAQKRVLHISSQPQPGFLSLGAPTSSKFRQQPKVKHSCGQSVHRVSTLEKQPTFALPETQRTALECGPERPKAVRVPFIPKGTPLYRIPVDYNIFRYVCKHRERPPRTASSPNLRGTAKGM